MNDLEFQLRLKKLIENYYIKRSRVTSEQELIQLNESYKKAKKNLKKSYLRNEGVKDLAQDIFIEPTKKFVNVKGWKPWQKKSLGVAATGAALYGARKAYLAAKRKKAMQGIPEPPK